MSGTTGFFLGYFTGCFVMWVLLGIIEWWCGTERR